MSVKVLRVEHACMILLFFALYFRNEIGALTIVVFEFFFGLFFPSCCIALANGGLVPVSEALKAGPMNNNVGKGKKGLAEQNHMFFDKKSLENGVVNGGVASGSSTEDDTRFNKVVEDGNNGLRGLIQIHGSLQISQQPPQEPAVCWERFLPLRSIKVLLVEDDDSTRHVVRALLQNCSYKVTAVSNGLQAWKVLEDPENGIDLVLTEVAMPILSGIGLLCKIMSHKTLKNIPVINLKLALHNPQHEMVLKGGLTWKVGNGTKIKFWEDHWGFGDTSLLAKYPSLYLISDQQHNYIQEMGQQTDKGWEWKFKWRRHLFDRELEMADCFLSEVAGSSIQIHKKDEWIWKAEPTGQYSVTSAYNMLNGVDVEEDNGWMFEELWKIRVPTKITIFAWRLLKERLQTKANLRRRRVAINDPLCPFCGNSEENEAHVFLTCDKILPLWWESMKWVNLHGAFPQKPWQHFSQHAFCFPSKIRINRWRSWWLALTWTVWQHRNKIIFSNETFDGNKLMEDAIFTLWTWLKNFEKDFALTYSYWSSNIAAGFVFSGGGSGSESATLTRKFAKSRSNDAYENNSDSSDENDYGSRGLSIRDGSDNGSGTQSSWTKCLAQVGSPHPVSPHKQLVDAPDSTCAQVMQTKTEKVSSRWVHATEKECHELIDLDDVARVKDLAMGISLNMQLEHPLEELSSNPIVGKGANKMSDVDDMQIIKRKSNVCEKGQLEYNGDKTGTQENQAMNVIDVTDSNSPQAESRDLNTPNGFSGFSQSKANCCPKEHPSLELTLKRLGEVGDAKNVTGEECNVLRHSDQSAFSKYNTVSANQAQTGNVGSCSPLDNSSAAPNTETMHNFPSHSNGTPSNQKSNGSNNINDRASTNTYLGTKPDTFDKKPESGRGIGSSTPQCVSSNAFGGPAESNAANYGVDGNAVESDHGSNNGQDGSNNLTIRTINVENGNVAAGSIGIGGIDRKSIGNGTDEVRLALREAALTKFRLKRKERCFEKRVRYHSRKKLAEQRPRIKGQFVRRIVSEGKEEKDKQSDNLVPGDNSIDIPQ
ncbi:Two-component response regulator-like PRR37 [Glycine max]|nr:Two-component response regulator-like PRR37 [Glycine max]